MMKKLAMLIIKRIIAGRNTRTPSERYRIAMIEGWTGIIGNVFLAVIKFIFGFLSGSISLIADAVHTTSDISSSAVIIIGFKVSKKDPDKEHPFGHGRVEYLTGLIVALMLIAAGIAIIINSYGRLNAGVIMQPSIPALLVVIFSIFFKELMFHFSYECGKIIDSEALIADAIHHRSDSLSSVAVLIALFCAFFEFGNLDAIFGFLVSAFIIYSGIKIGLKSADRLLGKAPCEQTSSEIYESVMAIEGVISAHDLDVHDYGEIKSITIHIEVDGKLSLIEAHEIAVSVETRLRGENNCHSVVHLDPHRGKDKK